MNFFGTASERKDLEIRLPLTTGVQRLRVLERLAWYLREADGPRAEALACEADALLSDLPALSPRERTSVEGRLLLTRAWMELRQDRLDAVDALMRQARDRFSAIGDTIGLSDTRALEGFVASSDSVWCAQAFPAAEALATRAGDTLRALTLRGYSLWEAVANEPSNEVQACANGFVDDARALGHPLMEAETASILALLHLPRNEYASAIVQLQRCFALRVENGQLWFAINDASMLSHQYRFMEDHTQSIAWAEQALTLATSLGWRNPVAWSHLMRATAMQTAGRCVAARESLQKSLAMRRAGRRESLWLYAQIRLAEVECELGQYPRALRRARLVEFTIPAIVPGRPGGPPARESPVTGVQLVQARALHGLNRPDEAVARALQASANAVAQGHGPWQGRVLIELASIARTYSQAPPQGSEAASAEIHYLEAARALYQGMEGYCVPVALWSDLSRAYAAAGDMAQSIACVSHAAAAREADALRKSEAISTLQQHMQRLREDKLALERDSERLTRDALIAKMQERHRIARELHDTLLQSVTGVVLRIQSVLPLLPPGDKARAVLERTLESADRTLAEGRDRVLDLRRPPANLPEALEAIGRELETDHASRFSLTVEGIQRALSPTVDDEAFRIGKEALENAFRHSNAACVQVTLSYRPDGLDLTVRDDGCGIAPDVVAEGERPGHSGLPGMRERASRIGGRLDILSQSLKGTLVACRLPDHAAAR